MTHVVCNKCGKMITENEARTGTYHSLFERFSYGSKHDGEVFEADFCAGCFDKIAEKIQSECSHNPIHEQF